MCLVTVTDRSGASRLRGCLAQLAGHRLILAAAARYGAGVLGTRWTEVVALGAAFVIAAPVGQTAPSRYATSSIAKT